MNWNNAILILLVLIVVGSIGYAVFSEDGLLVVKDMVLDKMKGNKVVTEADLPKLPIKTVAPDITGIVDWINSEPLTSDSLKGKVVLIDFWTYSCINCIRTYPFVQGWHDKYKDKGLVLIGVHTPEFDFEKVKSNIIQAAEENGLTYPIAMDNDYATWKEFENHYWPAHYLIDADGNIRYTHFGEGKYAETEEAIQSLLVEAGLASVEEFNEAEEEKASSNRSVQTPEIYFGYKRIDNFGSAADDIKPDVPFDFVAPALMERNQFYFDGQWKIGPESSELTGESGKILLEYKAKQVNMVMEHEPASGALVEILLDGQPLTHEESGSDVFFEDGRSLFRVKEAKLYNLVESGESTWRKLEIISSDAGLKAFTFTFG